MTVGILEEIEAERLTRNTCTVCTWLDEQDDDDRAKWETAMRDKTVPTTAIFRAMRKHEYAARTDGPVATHRKTHLA